MELFNIVSDERKYFTKLSQFKVNETAIPLLIKPNRPDLSEISQKFLADKYTVAPFVKCKLGMIISSEALSYQEQTLFCEQWITSTTEIKPGSNLVIIGLDKDFTQKNLLTILEECQSKNVSVYFLLGRDLSSLSWFIAKQFLHSTAQESGLFSYKKSLNFTPKNKNCQIFTAHDLETKDIKEILVTNTWAELIFHGHGKEDHLNLADFTLHGFDRQIPWDGNFAPSWGHKGQKFFKDETKAIKLSTLQVDKLFLLSCSNFPFSDARLYGARYSLVLNAIDGFAQNIVASIAVQAADLPEIAEILSSADEPNIGVYLQEKLTDVQPYVSLVNIGLPKKLSKVQPIKPAVRLTKLTKTILARLSSYASSTMLEKDHEITRWSQKILADTLQYTRRGTRVVTLSDATKFELDLRNRVNPLTKKMGQILQQEASDPLADFDSFTLYRSVVDHKSFKQVTCDCGRVAKNCDYLPEIPTLLKLNATYCYLCGDKLVTMPEMPKVVFTCDEFNQEGMQLNYTIEITPQNLGDVFLLVQVPSYIEKYVAKPQLKRLRFKSLRTVTLKETLQFDPAIPLQSYYLKLSVLQNAGLAVSRCFFNLVESS